MEFYLPLRRVGTGHLEHGDATAMWYSKRDDSKGQNLIEYTIIVAVVSSALLAMSIYVFRAVQGTQQMIQNEFSDD
jgi:Flp pilus assembly pilin Flp